MTTTTAIEAVNLGVDLFDCVMPARNGRHGNFYTRRGVLNIKNEKYERDERPIDEECGCPVCRSHTRAYIRHLFKAGEMLAMRLGVMHNLWYYNELMSRIRNAIENDSYAVFKADFYKNDCLKTNHLQ